MPLQTLVLLVLLKQQTAIFFVWPKISVKFGINELVSLSQIIPPNIHMLKDTSLLGSFLLFSALLCKIAALRSFSLDKLHYWRESASGMSSLAYFLSKDTIENFNTVIKPAVYLSMFYFFTNPRSSFADNYTVLFSLVYCVTGIAYALAIVFEPGTAQLVSNRSTL